MPRWIPTTHNWPSAFNTPLECGLRSVVLLVEGFPLRLDLQRLVQYDYLLVHSSYVPDGPDSLHPATPHRAGELLVRRPIIEQGIEMMMSKSILACEFSREGIRYFAGEWAVTFVGRLESHYVKKLTARAAWVIERFGSYTESELDSFMRQNWAHWGAEFEFESLLRTESA